MLIFFSIIFLAKATKVQFPTTWQVERVKDNGMVSKYKQTVLTILNYHLAQDIATT